MRQLTLLVHRQIHHMQQHRPFTPTLRRRATRQAPNPVPKPRHDYLDFPGLRVQRTLLGRY